MSEQKAAEAAQPDGYVPTTQEVESHWADVGFAGDRASFWRWLDAHDAEVSTNALELAADSLDVRGHGESQRETRLAFDRGVDATRNALREMASRKAHAGDHLADASTTDPEGHSPDRAELAIFLTDRIEEWEATARRPLSDLGVFLSNGLAEWLRLHAASQDTVSIPRPFVPHGPDGVPENRATAHYLRQAIKKIDSKHAVVGGSNVTATVRKLLADTAAALEAIDEGVKQ